MLENTPNQPTKFRATNWVEINYDSCGMYNTISQIQFKTAMLKPSLYDYGDAHILIKVTIPVANAEAVAATTNNIYIYILNCTLFTDFISKVKQYTNR